ncbi:malic enzyme-like NAD(P)-binding protein [Bacillus salipaludis]|nr:malic enzyme-like NAD(P)-binding protein [Bacillus salipaludis]
MEDIAVPNCFIIEETLKKEMNIPVFHDNQHGTAIVTAAGLITTLKVVGKHLEDTRVVVNGADAPGIAITVWEYVTSFCVTRKALSLRDAKQE